MLSAPERVSGREIFVGRQPIYNRDLDVIAYELLYRGGDVEHARITHHDHATHQVIENSVIEIGLEHVSGHVPAFFNVSREFILGDYPLPPSSVGVGIELLEDMPVDQTLVDAVRRLSRQGYTILLDDFIFHDSLKPLVDLADIIKIDVLAMDQATTREHVEVLGTYPAKLLAEKVENPECFEYCKELGFDYFQGFFFCKPKIIKGRRTPVDTLTILDLLAQLHAPGMDADALVAVIDRDVGLRFGLLRLLNSEHFHPAATLDSIAQAVTTLGEAAVRNWASVLALSRIGGKPEQLLVTAIVRGKMCEQLAVDAGAAQTEAHFLTGVCSLLDAMLDQALPEVVSSLVLPAAVERGAVEHAGPCGDALVCALAYERGDWGHVTYHDLHRDTITDSYLQAVDWADDVAVLLHSA